MFCLFADELAKAAVNVLTFSVLKNGKAKYCITKDVKVIWVQIFLLSVTAYRVPPPTPIPPHPHQLPSFILVVLPQYGFLSI